MSKLFLWKMLYSDWKNKPKDPKPGYTLLLMVPGDIPVFLQIVTEICATQNFGNRVETIVVPDNISPGFLKLFEDLKSRWTKGPFLLKRLSRFEYFLTHRLNSPFANCWLQFMRGCEAASARYLLWHDADLFLDEPDYLENHYKACAAEGLVCRGASQAWDDWYRKNGYPHLVSTWELLVDLKWVKSFKPWQHRGHEAIIHGKPHTVDITFLPQCLTDPSKIRLAPQSGNFVHFNHVIASYRKFQNSQGPFEDGSFRLLLVRLLIDAYDRSGWSYEVPGLEALLNGVKDAGQRVTYVSPETAAAYPEFRAKFQHLLDSGILSAERVNILKSGIRHFDESFAWQDAAAVVPEVSAVS